MSKLVLLGAGKMGSALLEGWLQMGVGLRTIDVIDPAPSPDLKAHAEAGRLSLSAAPSSEGYGEGDILVLAVKPQIMPEALAPLAAVTKAGAVVVSVAAGCSLEFFSKEFVAGVGLIRAMPNLPASIGEGITVAVAGEGVSDDARAETEALLSAVGRVAWTGTESDIDAVTAVSGSGPAYVFLMIEALAAAGEAEGLSPDLALTLARETVRGAGLLASQSDLLPATLRENVTSPGGTTAAALSFLMAEGGLPDLIAKAVKAAAERSRELGQ